MGDFKSFYGLEAENMRPLNADQKLKQLANQGLGFGCEVWVASFSKHESTKHLKIGHKSSNCDL